MALPEVRLLYELGYVMPSVGNIIDDKSCANMIEFPTAVMSQEFC
jgi:hypothetical protein